MSTENHLESLKEKHMALEAAIVEENNRPMPDGGVLSSLKKQKLKLKEEIEQLKNSAA